MAIAGVTWYEYGQLTDGVTQSDALDLASKSAPKHLDNSINILLIGLDSRKGNDGQDLPGWFVQDELHAGSSSEVGGYNTNSLILLHIPADQNAKVEAVSIPRDDYVMTYNGDGTPQGMHKIKEAYGIAKAGAMSGLEAKGLKGAALEQASRDVGRAATLATVQKFLDVPIDHFAEVNLIGFYDVAKAVGPVTVCLNHATADPAMEGQGSGANFHAGLNVLQTPAEALSFVRQRHNLTNTDGNGNGGDFARTHRQQAYITSAETQLKKEGILSDLGKLQGLIDTVKKDVVIDNRWNLLDFAQQAPNLSGGKVTFNTLPITAQPKVYIPGEGYQDVNQVSVPQVQRTVAYLFHDAAPAPASSAASSPSAGTTSAATAHAVVDVLNGGARAGSAGIELDALVTAGYTRGHTGNHAAVGATRVLYGAGAQTAASRIASGLGAAATASGAVAAGTVEVILGPDFTPPSSGSSGSSGSAAGAHPSNTPHLVFQGSAVNGGGNGIPCVD
ncbi:cell envelope-related function transcriptional attenuator common domain-containing protein [Streptacidiphilus jiangxiensis]|uniref:Cell envelope-related function transcriptional attenuator common domain-containing protein n=2 Tax=Streptacidiphilus jiangxiensis TaxID=235985 RepID=A0A1H7VZ93_STRJI|nr:cell envelope-related function transcriptional attenuator common domain-containing protein [Streptacidiphilus jiangxiensis]